jgi:hypothetical protein
MSSGVRITKASSCSAIANFAALGCLIFNIPVAISADQV